jgi:SHS2 domain-containing protein
MPLRGEFRFLDGIAPADAAFEATGHDLAEVFCAAARAVFAIIIDLNSVKAIVSRQVTLEAESQDELLYAWLSELVYLKDVHRELYTDFDIAITTGKTLRLQATIRGDSLDNLGGLTLTDVKAITYHLLAMEPTTSGLKATVVVDL